MRFVSIVNGVLAKARRGVSQATSVGNSFGNEGGSDEPSPADTAKALRQLMARVNKLESASVPEATEFEVVVGINGAVTELQHNFKGPVRWWVTGWLSTSGSAYPVKHASLVEDSTSTQTVLRLRSYVGGRAVIRVEPSQAYVEPGIIVAGPTANFVAGATYTAAAVSGMRLTLTTAVPVTSADVTAAATLYLTPYLSGQIRLYYGGEWILVTSPEVSLAVGTLTTATNYDVFAYWTGSAVALEFSAAWASATARTTALVRQDGILTKTGDATRLYVGTIRTASATTIEDSKSKRFCWNMYNRVTRFLSVVDTTASWTYVNSNTVWRQVRASATNQFEAVTGEDTEFSIRSSIGGSNNTGALALDAGVGIDSTTVNSAQIFNTWTNGIGQLSADRAHYSGVPGSGYHKYVWLETGGGALATWTYFGTGAGMTAEFLG